MKILYFFSFIAILFTHPTDTFAGIQCDDLLDRFEISANNLDDFFDQCDDEFSERCGRKLKKWQDRFDDRRDEILEYQCGGNSFASSFRKSMSKIKKLLNEHNDYTQTLKDEGYF